MTTIPIDTPDNWQEGACTRITERWQAGDALGCWSILRNPDNTVSRRHVRTLDPEAPLPSASIAVWRAFLDTRFPALTAVLAERKAQQDADAATRQQAWQQRERTEKATRGPAWRYREVVYPHALAFVTHLLSAGYVAEALRMGTVRFIHPDGRYLGPYRNAHINAALVLAQAEHA